MKTSEELFKESDASWGQCDICEDGGVLHRYFLGLGARYMQGWLCAKCYDRVYKRVREYGHNVLDGLAKLLGGWKERE